LWACAFHNLECQWTLLCLVAFNAVSTQRQRNLTLPSRRARRLEFKCLDKRRSMYQLTLIQWLLGGGTLIIIQYLGTVHTFSCTAYHKHVPMSSANRSSSPPSFVFSFSSC